MNIKAMLQNEGWQGFVPVKILKTSTKIIPEHMGVYMLLRIVDDTPIFMEKGSGGFFKGTDPNVSLADLESNWIEGSHVVYIGKAGGYKDDGSVMDATLMSRLKLYMRFGDGKDVGHKGGRYVWQLKDHDDLLVCWLPTKDEPRGVEFMLLECFKKYHNGRRPFANLQDGTFYPVSFEIGKNLLLFLSE